MKTEELTTIEHLSNFLEGTQAVAFTISSDKDKRYRWLQRELVRFDYLSLNKPDKGIVIRYLLKVTGYSRQQSNTTRRAGSMMKAPRGAIVRVPPTLTALGASLPVPDSLCTPVSSAHLSQLY